MSNEKLAEFIHSKGHKGVIAITGGGSGAINELLRYGGGSATLLEAIVPYSKKSLEDFIDDNVDKFVSIKTALKLAVAAEYRAKILGDDNSFGLGVTSKLMKREGEREGRVNEAYIALDTDVGDESFCMYLHYVFNKDLASESTRTGQEKVLSRLVLEMIARLHKKKIILAGSFNPLHDDHRGSLSMTKRILPERGEACYEISIKNIDKGEIDPDELLRRMEQFQNVPVLITKTPMLQQKADLFPNSTFVLGMDTWNRLDPKYYRDLRVSSPGKLEDKLKDLYNSGAKLVVFARFGKHLAPEEVEKWNDKIGQNFITAVSPDVWMGKISSTMIRNEEAP